MSSSEVRPVLVTGGAQGIGRAIVARALSEGRPVTVLEEDAGAAAELEARHVGAPLLVVEGDVAVEADVRRAVERAVRRHGGLAAAVHNAGIGHNGPVEELTLEDWNRVIGVNLTGAFLVAKHAAGHLRASRGVLVNIASTRALMSEADTEAYSASKGGIVAFTHALAISLGPEVRVNAVSPGWIEVRDHQKSSEREEPELRDVDHAQHPVGRVGRPADIAATVAWLWSDEASFVTGQNFVVDGGMTRKMIYEH